MKRRNLLAVVLAVALVLSVAAMAIPVSAEGEDWDGKALPAANASYAYSGGSGTEGDPYLVSIPYDLAMMAANTNGGASTNPNTAGKYFRMTQDIDMTGKAFQPIGGNSITSSYLFFSGFFDGGGHTVSGLSMTVNSKWINAIGFFGTVASGCSIRNLTVEGTVTVAEKAYNNVTYLYVGGIVGFAYGNLTMENVTSKLNITVTETDASIATIAIGGILAEKTTAGTVTLVHCSNEGDIVCNGNGNAVNMGGIIGDMNVGNNAANASLTSCKSTGRLETTVSATDRIGGLVGQLSGSSATLAFRQCHVDIEIANKRSDSWQAGAMLGYIWSKLTLANAVSGNHNIAYAARANGTAFYLCGRLNVSDVNVQGNAANATALDLPDYATVGRIAETGLLSNNALQLGTAESDSGKTSIRFVSEFAGDIAAYSEAGYRVTVTYGGSSATVTLTDTKVFSSILANGEPIAPSVANAYFLAIGLKNVPASGTITFVFTPYVLAEGETVPVFGNTVTATVTNGSIGA